MSISIFQLRKLKELFSQAQKIIESEISKESYRPSFSQAALKDRAAHSEHCPENYYYLKFAEQYCFISHDYVDESKVVDYKIVKELRHVYHIGCKGFKPNFKGINIKGDAFYKSNTVYYGNFDTLGEAKKAFMIALRSLLIDLGSEPFQGVL